jgi:hypothetical protein
MNTDVILVSREVSQRTHEESKLKKFQHPINRTSAKIHLRYNPQDDRTDYFSA